MAGRKGRWRLSEEMLWALLDDWVLLLLLGVGLKEHPDVAAVTSTLLKLPGNDPQFEANVQRVHQRVVQAVQQLYERLRVGVCCLCFNMIWY